MFIPKGIIKYPERAIRISKLVALKNLIPLTKRGITIYNEPYFRISEQWKEAWTLSKNLRKAGDDNHFIPICDIEKPLRKNHLDMVFNTCAFYGNKEVKRVYAWREGTIGPLNTLLNKAGARLRFLGMTRYPLPRPSRTSIEHIDKAGNPYHQEHSTYGTTKGKTTVILSHPFLPELDFVDMLRGHLVELCRQCFINSVPHSEAGKYIDQLLYRLRPFLDRLYTGTITPGIRYRLGTGGFSKKADVILDEIINTIKGEHGTRISYPERITERIDTGKKPFTKTALLALVGSKQTYNKMDAFLTDKDAEKFAYRINNVAGRIGSRIHRRTAWGLINPSSSRSVIHGGDYIAQDTLGFIHAAEVPVYSGRGSADHSLLIRRQPVEIPNMTNMGLGNWFPSMVLDLKTRSAFRFNVRGKKQPGGRGIVPEFIFRRRRLTDQEWEEMLNNTPLSKEERQVTTYGEGLLKDYHGSVREDLEPPPVNIRGIIVTDGTESPTALREVLSPFIHVVYDQFREEFKKFKKKQTRKKSLHFPRVLFELKGTEANLPRLAIVTLPFKISKNITPEVLFPTPVPLQEVLTSNPFTHRNGDSLHFILYVSVSTHGSPGDSAARIARDYHGLEFAYSSAQEYECKRVGWLDLAGEFIDKSHRAVIFRVNDRSANAQIFYDDIDFIDLSDKIEDALFEGSQVPSVESLKQVLKMYDLILVSGIETVRSLTPQRLKGIDDTLITHIAEAIPSSVKCLIWFDSPVSHASTSELFKHHCFQPVRFDSPLLSYIDEITLNLPYPPQPGGSEVPICDYARGIAKIGYDVPNEMTVNTVAIPPLIGWSKRFRSIDLSSLEKSMVQRFGRKSDIMKWLDVIGITEYTEDMVLELFPLLPTKSRVRTKKKTDRLSVSVQKLKDSDRTPGYRGVLSRTTYDKYLTRKGRPKVQPLSDINGRSRTTEVKILSISDISTKLPHISIIDTQPKHWTPKLNVEPIAELTLPPKTSDLTFQEIDLKRAQAMELTQLQEARKIIKGTIPEYSPLFELLEEFVKILAVSIGSKKPNALMLSFSDFLAEHRHTREIWKRISWFRNYLDGWQLPSEIHKSVEDLQTKDPRFLLYYGNYFVLLLSRFWQTHNFTLNEIQELWEMIRPWINIQLGAKRRSSSLPQPIFDLPTIYEQMRSRTKYYQGRTKPQTVPIDKVRYGITVDLHFRNPGRYRWYIFEREPFSKDVIMGCMNLDDARKGYSLRGNTIIPLDELSRLAGMALQKGEFYPIMLLTHSGTDLLYQGNHDGFYSLDLDYSSVEWNPMGVIRFGTRYRGAPARLRFVKVVNPGISFPTSLGTHQKVPRRKKEPAKKFFSHLAIIQGRLSTIQRCKCRIAGTDEKGEIAFISIQRDGEKAQPSVIHNYSSRQEAEGFLMYPYVTGIPFMDEFTWDPLNDIDYQQYTGDLEETVRAKIQIHKKEES